MTDSSIAFIPYMFSHRGSVHYASKQLTIVNTPNDQESTITPCQN